MHIHVIYILSAFLLDFFLNLLCLQLTSRFIGVDLLKHLYVIFGICSFIVGDELTIIVLIIISLFFTQYTSVCV